VGGGTHILDSVILTLLLCKPNSLRSIQSSLAFQISRITLVSIFGSRSASMRNVRTSEAVTKVGRSSRVSKASSLGLCRDISSRAGRSRFVVGAAVVEDGRRYIRSRVKNIPWGSGFPA
jgi:hypothetical protein